MIFSGSCWRICNYTLQILFLENLNQWFLTYSSCFVVCIVSWRWCAFTMFLLPSQQWATVCSRYLKKHLNTAEINNHCAYSKILSCCKRSLLLHELFHQATFQLKILESGCARFAVFSIGLQRQTNAQEFWTTSHRFTVSSSFAARPLSLAPSYRKSTKSLRRKRPW